MKLANLKSAGDSSVEKDAGGSPHLATDTDGADMHLMGDHMKAIDAKSGMDADMGSLPHGHPVRFEGRGVVHRTSDGPEGGSLQIKVHKMGVEYETPEEKRHTSLREDLEKTTKDSDEKGDKRQAVKEDRRKQRAESEGEE